MWINLLPIARGLFCSRSVALSLALSICPSLSLRSILSISCYLSFFQCRIKLNCQVFAVIQLETWNCYLTSRNLTSGSKIGISASSSSPYLLSINFLFSRSYIMYYVVIENMFWSLIGQLPSCLLQISVRLLCLHLSLYLFLSTGMCLGSVLRWSALCLPFYYVLSINGVVRDLIWSGAECIVLYTMSSYSDLMLSANVYSLHVSDVMSGIRVSTCLSIA